jgi:hypothetical protein
MKEYEGSSTKAFKATYTGAATALKNKGAATKNVKKYYDKVFDMLNAIVDVSKKLDFLHH